MELLCTDLKFLMQSRAPRAGMDPLLLPLSLLAVCFKSGKGAFTGIGSVDHPTPCQSRASNQVAWREEGGVGNSSRRTEAVSTQKLALFLSIENYGPDGTRAKLPVFFMNITLLCHDIGI